MVAADWRPQAIAFALAIPAGLAAWLLTKIAWLLFADLDGWERTGAVAASLAIGLTAGMSVGQLGTTTNEWPGAALTLAALWVLLRELARMPAAEMRSMSLLVAGALAGIATGLKLTAGPFAVGLCAALLLRRPWRVRSVREAFVFGVAVLGGAAVAYGPWAATLWSHFDSPVFPYGNQYWKSPWWGEYTVMVRNYGPHSFGAWLMFPFRLLAPPTFYVAEVPYVDARFPVLYALAIVAAAGTAIGYYARWPAIEESEAAVARPPTGRSRLAFTATFFVVAFVVGAALYSILRYAIVLELLSGALIVALLGKLLRRPYAIAAVAVATLALIGTTRHPDWWRVKFGPHWFDVRVPQVEPNALILIASDAPMGYVLPFFPRMRATWACATTSTTRSGRR